MTHLECFVVATWMITIGWYLGAIYVQNKNEKTETPRVREVPEASPNSEAWGIPAAA